MPSVRGCGAGHRHRSSARQPPASSMDPPNAGQVSPERWICTSGEPPPSTTPEPRADPEPLSDTLQLRRGFSPLQPLHVLMPTSFFLPRRGAPRLSAVTLRFIISNGTNHPPAVRLRLCGAFPGQEPTCSAVGPVALTPVAPRVSHAVSGRSWCPCLPLSASSGCVAAIPPEKLAPAAPALGLGGACPPGFGDPHRARAHPARGSALAGHLDLL